MITLEKWIIVETTNHFITTDRYTTDKLLLIKNGYAVTRSSIYKLGSPDNMWQNTSDYNNKLELFT